MNDFTIKKLAEVQAFCLLAAAISERVGTQFAASATETSHILETIEPVTIPSIWGVQQTELFDTKVTKTILKLTTMMELYVGDEWANFVEVLEWLSFYAGAASAHAELAVSALKALEMNDEAHDVADLSDQFSELLASIKWRLAQVGSERALS